MDLTRVRKTPPGPRLQVDLEHAHALDPLALYLSAQRSYGDVVRIQGTRAAWYLIAHPDGVRHVLQDNGTNYRKNIVYNDSLAPLLGHGLLTSEGEAWRKQRRLVQPAFHAHQVTAWMDGIAEPVEAMLRGWGEPAREGRALNLGAELRRLLVEIVGRALFGADLQATADGIAASLGSLFDAIPKAHGRAAPAARCRAGANGQALDRLRQAVDRIIAQRRSGAAAGDDLLSLLLSARAAGELSEEQLREQIVTLLFTGYETCSNVLAWACYLVAGAPEVELRLRQEVEEVLGGRAPTAGDLGRLDLTGRIILETMRLYPPVWSFGRRPERDDEIDGFRIPAGALVVLSPYVTHRHAAFWQDPERFDPERFGAEPSSARPRFAYFPFGGGLRHCVAHRFALAESQIVLAMIASRYRVTLAPDHPVAVEAASTLRPLQDVWVVPRRW